jgi:hypothetical protein
MLRLEEVVELVVEAKAERLVSWREGEGGAMPMEGRGTGATTGALPGEGI